MARVRPGERVRVVQRGLTEQDVASMSYFPHYAGLEGEVTRVYDSGEAAVKIDPECLDPSVSEMHERIRERVAEKFFTALSEEGRKRLTPEEKDIRLNYVVLVKLDDLQPIRGSKTATPKANDAQEKPPTTPKRPTAQDLAKAEQEYLAKRKRAK